MKRILALALAMLLVVTGCGGNTMENTYQQITQEEAKDMMELRERGEAIAFVYGHYIRCKKLRYFEDPYIAPILKRRQQELAALHEAQAQAEPTEKDTTT